MIGGKTDNPIGRYLIHALMILLGLVAIVPVYVLLINSTRSIEQINSGLSIIFERGAFNNVYDEFVSVTRAKAGETGHVKYEDVILGKTYEMEDDQKRILYSLPEDLNPRILIINEENGAEIIVETYAIPKGAFIVAEEGSRVKSGTVLYKNFNLTSEVSGKVVFVELIPDVVLLEETDKRTGNQIKYINEYETNSKPAIRIVNDSGQVMATYSLPTGSYLEVKEGEKIEAGKILVKLTKKPPNVINNWRALTDRGFKIWHGFGNSALIAISATLLTIYFSALTAYGLHVYNFKGKTAIWVIILVIMMLPGSLIFIGFYQFMVMLRLTGTYLPLILPGIAAAATVLFIRQYMSSVLNKDLIDAARIDGAGEFSIFNVIILPVIIPALAAQAIFAFVGSWNNYLAPFVILGGNEKLHTLPIMIMYLRGDIYRTNYGAIYLGIAVSLIPILIFYSFMSRYIISGITMGGIKE